MWHISVFAGRNSFRPSGEMSVFKELGRKQFQHDRVSSDVSMTEWQRGTFPIVLC